MLNKSITESSVLDFFADILTEGKAAMKESKVKTIKAAQQAKAKETAQKKLVKALPMAAAISDQNFISKYQTAVVVHQTCDCCQMTVRYVGAVLSHQQHARIKTTWREVPAPLDSSLPMTTRIHEMKTPVCASCLTQIEHIQDYLTSSEFNKTQMALF